MEIDKLFHVLVVGGALTVGCGGAPTKPAEAPASQPEAPASQPQAQPGADDGASSGEGKKEEEGQDGVCGWF